MPTVLPWVLLLLCLFSPRALAFHAETNQLQSAPTERLILSQVYFQATPSNFNLDDLLSDPEHHHNFKLVNEAPRLLFSEREAIWFFARIKNTSNRVIESILEYNFPLADKIEIYQVNRQNQDIRLLSRSGTDYPYRERAMPFRSFAVGLKLPVAEEIDVFIKIQDAAIIPNVLQLWPLEQFTAAKQRQAMLDGLLQGFLLLLALYNLILLAQHKAKHYVYFAGFFISFALTIGILNGMAFALLWPNYPEINQAILYIVVGANLFCFNMFIRYAMRGLTNFWWQLTNYLSCFLALSLLFSPLFAGGQTRLYLLFAALGWALFSSILLALRLSIKGPTQTRSFVWACVFTLISALLLTLGQAGYLHANFNWSYIPISLVLLSLALTSFNLHQLQISPLISNITAAEHAQYQAAFHQAAEAMFSTTTAGKVLNANSVLLDMFGYPNIEQLKRATAGTSIATTLEQQILALHAQPLGTISRFDARCLHADNHQFWARISLRAGVVNASTNAIIHGSIIDITEQKSADEQLVYLANHDHLTTLYNRYYFEQQLNTLCSQEGVGKGCVLYIDVDQYRTISNNCNRVAADMFLQQLSDTLKQVTHHNGPLARLDSDEFAILLTGKSANEAFALAYKLLDVVREFSFTWQDTIHHVSACIGITEIQPEDNSAKIILEKAYIVCSIAKEKGANRIQLFDSNDADVQRHQAKK